MGGRTAGVDTSPLVVGRPQGAPTRRHRHLPAAPV